MTKSKLLIGVAGMSVLGLSVLPLGCVAKAQETAAPVAQQAAAPAQQPQAEASDCSGLGCLFGSRREAQPQPIAAQPADTAAAQAEPEPAYQSGAEPDASQPGTSKRPPRKVAAKPAYVVTIAAEGPEMARLQRLAAAMPKEKIKIVKTRGDGDRSGSDFSVSTALEPTGATEATKLFTEQMHIVAGGTVRSVADLRGKVVSFGPDKSPGQAAARKAFEALDVHVTETPLDIDNALDGLATGDVAAVVILAPQPIDRLKSVSAPGIHLVSWPEGGSLPSGATAATIDAAAYPGLAKPGETIRAMGVDALLTMSAKGAKQGAAKTFLKALSEHSEALTKRGFDLLKADLDSREGRHLASAERF